MFKTLIETIKNSLQDVLANSVKVIPAIFTAIIIIMLTRYAANLARQITVRLGRKAVKDRSLQILLTKISYTGTWVIGVVIACVVAFPGLRLGDIIATLGLGSVAIGFAFQDIFKNFLAGILILVQQPFRIDDQIVVDSYEGTVERIDIRTTKIKTYQGEQILIPNSTMFTSAVTVKTAYPCRRTDLMVGVDYNTDLSKAVDLLYKIIDDIDGIIETPEAEVDVVNFGGSSIDLIVRYWSDSRQKSVRQTQTKAVMAIKKIFDQEDINIPYPIRTLYFYNQTKFDDSFSTSSNNNGNGNSLPNDNNYSSTNRKDNFSSN